MRLQIYVWAITAVFISTLSASAQAPVRDGGQAAASQPADARPVGSVLRLLVRNRICYVAGEVNGRHGLLLVDTGTSNTHLYSDVASELGLKPLAVKQIDTFIGKRPERLTVLNKLAVGPIASNSIPIFIDEHDSFTVKGGQRVLGILGMDVLGRRPVAMDFRNLNLSFWNPGQLVPPKGAAHEIRRDAQTLEVRATVEGCDGWFEVDTGYSDTVLLSRAFAEQNTNLIFHRPAIHEGPVWGAPEFISIRWASADVLGHRLSEENGAYEWTGRLGPRLAGLIGTAHLRDISLVIDMASRRVWREEPEAESLDAMLLRVRKQFESNQSDMTPIMAAVELGRADAVESLLKAGESGSGRDERGVSLVIYAAARGKLDILNLLLAHGGKINDAWSSNGFTPLIFACQNGRHNTAQRLLDAGVDIDHAGNRGDTALFRAAEAGHADIVGLLLEHHAKVDAPLRTGETPLLAACANGDSALAKLLLEHHADPNAAGPRGNCLTYACYASSPECVKLLLTASADPNRHASSGPTPLMTAASIKTRNAAECVWLLLASGADPSPRGPAQGNGANGKTAFDLAVESGNVDSVMLLRP